MGQPIPTNANSRMNVVADINKVQDLLAQLQSGEESLLHIIASGGTPSQLAEDVRLFPK